ncbi:MAG: hypothetical protein PHF17_10120 [Arcobacteraceae bacterium]|nr:hypothetical protein [Arcobacteraceae bacterium]
MRIKKGIVLFVTILFILAISVLIVKNLEITDQFISLSSKNSNIKQLELTIKDVNSEIVTMFRTKQIKNLLDIPEYIPFEYGNIDVTIYLTEYDNTNSYKLDRNLSSVPEDIDKSLLLNIISDKNISNQKQVDYILDEYVKKTNDYQILKISNQFTYYPKLIQEPQDYYVSCRYDIDIDGLQANVFFIFNLKDYKIIPAPFKIDINIKR